MKRYLKMIGGALLLSVILSFILALINYTPAAERDPNTYYFSIGESFLFIVYWMAPFVLLISLLAMGVYWIWKRVKPAHHLAMVGGSILIAVGVTAGGFYIDKKTIETDDIYLIPEGYTGDVFIVYNATGAPIVKRENGFEVHPINEQGYFATSTPDMDYGTVTDKYYYIDKKGNRTPIDEKCVSLFGTGGFQTSRDEDIDLIYTGFHLTKDNCGSEFQTGNHMSEGSKEKMIQEILKKYYGLDEY